MTPCEDMNTAVAPNLGHISSSTGDHYDPDEDVLPKDSPLLQPHRPNLRPNSTPPPRVPLSQVSSPSSSDSSRDSNRRRKFKPSQGDAVLIAYMGDGKEPQFSQTAGTVPLPPPDPSVSSSRTSQGGTGESDDESEPEHIELEDDERQAGGVGRARPRESVSRRRMSLDPSPPRLSLGDSLHKAGGKTCEEPDADRMALDPPTNPSGATATLTRAPGRKPEDNSMSALKSLAVGALGALSLASPEPEPAAATEPVAALETAPEKLAARTPAHIDIQATRVKAQALEPPHVVATPREVPIREDRSFTSGAPSPYSPNGISPYSPNGVYSPRVQGLSPIHHVDLRSPSALPPIQGMGSPRSDTAGHLPSIREQLGDIRSLQEPTPDPRLFPHSPPAIARLSAMSHSSPPISPNDPYRRDMPSPAHPLSAQSPYSPYYPHMNGHPRSIDYSSSSATETPTNSELTASTPATSTSITDRITDRMSIDGITNPQVGAYVCKVPGCGAPPFQTQYLLNSHANVHSSARPHYCPVQGCTRSEGGKGFKRKNEMIRHGLVHDSPGYVCPFCPDREHRYPRPDNLQRHVRVHHMDKDKDDPLLRDVLAQRPDGPNRGRRRRGLPA